MKQRLKRYTLQTFCSGHTLGGSSYFPAQRCKEGTLLTGVSDDFHTQDAFPGPVVTNMVQASDGGTGEGQVNIHKQEKGS